VCQRCTEQPDRTVSDLIGPVFSEDLYPLPFVGLFVDGRPVTSEHDRRCPLDSNAQLILINAVAGG